MASLSPPECLISVSHKRQRFCKGTDSMPRNTYGRAADELRESFKRVSTPAIPARVARLPHKNLSPEAVRHILSTARGIASVRERYSVASAGAACRPVPVVHFHQFIKLAAHNSELGVRIDLPDPPSRAAPVESGGRPKSADSRVLRMMTHDREIRAARWRAWSAISTLCSPPAGP
jgi:hypothetical protein